MVGLPCVTKRNPEFVALDKSNIRTHESCLGDILHITPDLLTVPYLQWLFGLRVQRFNSLGGDLYNMSPGLGIWEQTNTYFKWNHKEGWNIFDTFPLTRDTYHRKAARTQKPLGRGDRKQHFLPALILISFPA